MATMSALTLRIGNEVAVAEEVSRPAHLNDVHCAQHADRIDLLRGEHRRVDPAESRDAPGQPACRRDRLVVGRNIERDPEPGRRRNKRARLRLFAERQVRVREHFEDLGDRDVAIEIWSNENNIRDMKFAIGRAPEHVGFGAQLCQCRCESIRAAAMCDQVYAFDTWRPAHDSDHLHQVLHCVFGRLAVEVVAEQECHAVHRRAT